MTAEPQLEAIVETWLKGTADTPYGVEQGVGRLVARLPQTRQRGRWWPLPSLRRTPRPAPVVHRRTFQPTPIPATTGRALTATGRTMPMFSATKFVVAGVIVALFGGALLIAQPFGQQGENVPGTATGEAGTFSPTGSSAEVRWWHTATLLPDGRVLVIGGDAIVGSHGLASAEVWDPATESFSPAGTLATGRRWHTATLLPDGRVLVVGGDGGDGGDGDGDGTSAEVWDPATESFATAGSLAESRRGHITRVLPDGRVLIIGGGDGDNPPTAWAEVWDPATESFGTAGSLAEARWSHIARVLPDGRVLIIGDEGSSAEVWDPSTGTLERAGGRWFHTATLLPDGRALVVGGRNSGGRERIIEAEVWDPQTTSKRTAGSLAQWREDHTATLLPDGRVLIVGGGADDATSAEVWDPQTTSFEPAGSLAQARWGHTATLLPDGRVLIVGGGQGDEPVLTAEVWEPSDG